MVMGLTHPLALVRLGVPARVPGCQTGTRVPGYASSLKGAARYSTSASLVIKTKPPLSKNWRRARELAAEQRAPPHALT